MNQAGAEALRVDPQGLLLTAPTEGFGAVNLHGLTKAISGPFDVRTRLELFGNATRFNCVGLAALSSSGAMVVQRMVASDGPVVWESARYLGPGSFAGGLTDGLTRPSPVVHVRQVFDGTVLRHYWSHDGRFWWAQVPGGEAVGPGQFLADVARVGIVWGSSNSMWAVRAYVPWIRRAA